MLTAEHIEAYNNDRHLKHPAVLCYAPYASMNFEQGGAVTACCYNRSHVYGRYPEQSLHDIWFGKRVAELQEAISVGDLSKGCALCENQIACGNYSNVRARGFDIFGEAKGIAKVLPKLFPQDVKNFEFPQVLEFELDNTCNLECKMCNGKFSSLIRKNREQLPPLENVYDEGFVDQLEEFIPHLKEAKFLGGEPFMIPIYWKIWQRISDLNPKVKIYITTNGTLLSSRIKKLLADLKPTVIISIDSLEKSTYEHIRVNANFDKVMQNVAYFRQYSEKYKKKLSFAFCPMTLNSREIPAIVRYCNQNNIWLYFNTVTSPSQYSLYALGIDELSEIYGFLSAQRIEAENKLSLYNLRGYEDLVESLKVLLKKLRSPINAKAKALSTIAGQPKYAQSALAQALISYKLSGITNSEKEIDHRSSIELALQKNPGGFPKASDLYVSFVRDYHTQISAVDETSNGQSLEENLKILGQYLSGLTTKKEISLLLQVDVDRVVKSLSMAKPWRLAEVLKDSNALQAWLNKESAI